MIRIRAIAFACSLLMPLLAVSPPVDAKSAAPSRRTAARAWYDSIKVPMRSWLPERQPRQVLLCLHGLGFSSESFHDFGRDMANRGIAVYAIDVRGFGAWLKNRSTKDNKIDFEGCLTDIENKLRVLKAAYPSTPIFIVGESMGGAIALRAASRWPQLVDGLISSVPSNERYAALSEKVWVGARYLTDKDEAIDIAPIVVKHATDDPRLQQQWKDDQQNRMELTPAELKQFNDFMKGNYDAAVLMETTPVLMLAGFQDKLVKPEGTIKLFNDITTKDKLLFVVGDGEHLLLEEGQMTDQLASLLVDWIRTEARKPHRVATPPKR